MWKRSLSSGFLIIAALALANPVVRAQSDNVIDLGTLGGTYSIARGISPDGGVAGDATTAGSVKHAVMWDGNGLTDLGAPPGFIVASAAAVNDAGMVAVNGEGNPQSIRAQLWDNGVWTSLGTLPGRAESIARDIDPMGRIVGTSLTFGAGNSAGFIWEAGAMTDLGTLGGSTRAKAINGVGQVVGDSIANLPGGRAGENRLSLGERADDRAEPAAGRRPEPGIRRE